MERNKSHTTQQWELHKFLKNNPFEYTKRIEILVALKEFYYPKGTEDFDILMSDIYHSQEGAQLNKDIKALKQSTIIKRILISNSQKGIKYATKEEAEDYFAAQTRAIRKKCILINTQKAKYGLNNQLVLQFTGSEKPIIESLMEVE